MGDAQCVDPFCMHGKPKGPGGHLDAGAPATIEQLVEVAQACGGHRTGDRGVAESIKRRAHCACWYRLHQANDIGRILVVDPVPAVPSQRDHGLCGPWRQTAPLARQPLQLRNEGRPSPKPVWLRRCDPRAPPPGPQPGVLPDFHGRRGGPPGVRLRRRPPREQSDQREPECSAPRLALKPPKSPARHRFPSAEGVHSRDSRAAT